MHSKHLQKNGSKHRHFVIIPVFVALLVASVLLKGEGIAIYLNNQSHPVTVSALQERLIALPSGAQAMLGGGTTVLVDGDRLVLQEGSLLLASQGIVNMEAGTTHMQGILGSIDVTFRNKVLTVAAISTPVLVDREGERLVIPVGFQWRSVTEPASVKDGWQAWTASRRFAAVPPDYLQAKMRQEQGLFAVQPPVASMEHAFGLSLGTFLRLPTAMKRFTQERTNWQLQELLSALQSDAETISPVTIRQTANALTASSLHASLPLLLSRARENPDLLLGILPPLFHDARLWLLSSLHPTLRTATWTLPSRPDVSTEVLALRLVSFPLSDLLPQATAPILVEKWHASLQEFVQAQQEPVSFVESLVSSLAPVAARMGEKGFPERMHRYASVLSSIAEPYQASLSKDAQAALEGLRKTDELSLKGSVVGAVPISQSAMQQSPSSASPLSPDVARHLEQQAYGLLRDAGALFTTQTQIHAVDSSSVQVEGIVFSGKAGDRTFAFVLDVSKRIFSQIGSGGQKMLYPMTMAEFLKWTK